MARHNDRALRKIRKLRWIMGSICAAVSSGVSRPSATMAYVVQGGDPWSRRGVVVIGLVTAVGTLVVTRGVHRPIGELATAIVLQRGHLDALADAIRAQPADTTLHDAQADVFLAVTRHLWMWLVLRHAGDMLRRDCSDLHDATATYKYRGYFVTARLVWAAEAATARRGDWLTQVAQLKGRGMVLLTRETCPTPDVLADLADQLRRARPIRKEVEPT